MDCSQGSIRIPIETEIDFQRAFSGSVQTLPFQQASHARVLDDTDCYRKIIPNPYLTQP